MMRWRRAGNYWKCAKHEPRNANLLRWITLHPLLIISLFFPLDRFPLPPSIPFPFPKQRKCPLHLLINRETVRNKETSEYSPCPRDGLTLFPPISLDFSDRRETVRNKETQVHFSHLLFLFILPSPLLLFLIFPPSSLLECCEYPNLGSFPHRLFEILLFWTQLSTFLHFLLIKFSLIVSNESFSHVRCLHYLCSWQSRLSHFSSK